MSRNAAVLAALLACLGIALAFRLPALDARPFHGDEANQAVRAGILLESGVYEYDPHEHHGPTLYYLALIPLRLSGARTITEANEADFRLLTVFFGAALILLAWPLRHALGCGAMLAAALFTAVSPVMVYYSRYFIQESLFIFFAFAAIAAGYGYWRRPGVSRALLTGACLGLTFATKETCVILFFSMAAALAGTLALARWRDGAAASLRAHARPACVAGVLLAGLAVSIVLYSAFFTHWRGVLDSVLAFTTYLERAEGAGSAGIHDKPWHYYLTLLGWTYRSAGQRYTEGLVLALGAVGIVAALLRRAGDNAPERVHFPRFLALYTLSTLTLFSLVPYKTPWNLLPFYHPLILMAGFGAAALFHALRWRTARAVLALALAAGTAHLAWQAHRANYVYAAHEGNPWVYAHTSGAFLRMRDRIEAIAALNPNPENMPIQVIQPDGDYWPIPWYLRRFKQVGYWTQPPPAPNAPVLVIDVELRPWLEENLQAPYFAEMYGLRPGVLRLLYIRRDLWDRFMENRR